MKKAFRALVTAAVVLITYLLAVVPVSAESNDYRIVTVTAIKDESAENGLANQGEYYLSDACAVSKLELEKYCDEKSELEYGDVLKIYCTVSASIIPGMYNWDMSGTEPKIEYLGKAADYYDTKELTVKDNNGGQCVTFEDAEGNEYLWHNQYNTYYYNPVNMQQWGYYVPEEFEPTKINAGDKFVCTVSTEIYYAGNEPLERDCVVVPVSVSSDINTDENNSDKNDFAEAGILHLKAGSAVEIPGSLEAREISVDDESIAVIGMTNYGPTYRVIGLKAGKTVVSMVPFSNINNETKMYIIEVEGEFPDNLEMSESEVSISMNDKYRMLHIINPDNDNWKDPSGNGWGIYDTAAKWSSDNENVVIVQTNGALIPCSVGNAAITAVFNGKEYTSKVTVTAPPVSEHMTGDANLDGKVDLYDVIRIAESIIGVKVLTDEETAAADINGNGKVDLYDAIGIAVYILDLPEN